ncbi:MAG: type II CAAX prenyl endopeptidase Rce1 family protein [Beutenbergiaceae bacterium]
MVDAAVASVGTTRPRWAQWRPGRDTIWALASIALMWLCYWSNTMLEQRQSWLSLVVFFIVGNIVVCTVIPAWVVTRGTDEGWAGLGFTRNRLVISLVITVVMSAGSLTYFLQLAQASGVDPVQHLAYNMVILWEPLFVYGWLYLRFRRAFGWLPGIVLAAAGFAGYHLGSVPLSLLAVYFSTGLLFSILMAITRNLWVIFPLASGISSGIGTVQAGLEFTWETAATGAVVLLVQGLVLWLIFRSRPALKGQR